MDSKQYLEDYISKTMKTDLTVAIKTILDENKQLEAKIEQLEERLEEMVEENIRRAEDEIEALMWEG